MSLGSVDTTSLPQIAASRLRATSRVAHHKVGPRRLLEAFVIFELLCQLALLWSVVGEFRFFFRLATFASNLALMVILPKHECRYHPAAKAAKWVMAIMCLELLNPQSNAKVAGVAEILLYLAVLGPLFWVPRSGIDLKAVRNVVIILWIFHTISSVIGILQIYYPGSFRFSVSSVYSHGSLQGLMYINGQGHVVFRPSGLSDVPGAAAVSGLYTTLIGLFLVTTYRNLIIRTAAALSIFAGFIVIYLSLVKAILLTVMASVIAFVLVSAWRNLMLLNRSSRARISVIVPAATAVFALVVGFSWATGLGGRPVTKAINGLTSKSAGNVYYGERGSQMEYAINNYLPDYPLGAGLGRFGMMCYYFGYPDDPDSPSLWAEIQWPAWLLDGGIALLIAYPVAILIAIWWALELSLSSLSLELGGFAIFVFAYDIGILAMTFDYSFFMSQDGIVFWLLNAMLFSAAVSLAQAPRGTRPAAATRMRCG